jgi:hypothetical protein
MKKLIQTTVLAVSLLTLASCATQVTRDPASATPQEEGQTVAPRTPVRGNIRN